MEKGQQVIRCKACGSNKIKLIGNLYLLLGLILLASPFFLLWLPVIGWIMIPIVLIGGIILTIASLFSKKYRVKCNACNNSFNVSKNDYTKFKHFIK